MAQRHNHSDRIWRSKLNEHQAPAPPQSWDRLDEALGSLDARVGAAATDSALLWQLRGRFGLVAFALLFGIAAFTGYPGEQTPVSLVHAPAAAIKAPAPLDLAGSRQSRSHAATQSATQSAGILPHAGLPNPSLPIADVSIADVSIEDAPIADAPIADLPIAAGRPSSLFAESEERIASAHSNGSSTQSARGAEEHASSMAQDGAAVDPMGQLNAADAASAVFPDASLASVSDAADRTPSNHSPAAFALPGTQRSVPIGLYGGINAGANLVALVNASEGPADENLSPGTRIGHAFGFQLGYRWHPEWSVETELIVDSRQGANFQSSMPSQGGETDVTKRVQLIYTQIPISVRYGGLRPGLYPDQAPRGGAATVFGVQYGMLRNSRLAVGDKLVSPERNFNQHDVSLLLGADYDIAAGRYGFFSLGLRGSFGLTRTRLTDLDGVNRDKRNATIGLRIAYNNWLSF